MTKNRNEPRTLSPKNLWKKRKWDILFVAFVAYMLLVPQNPVRLKLTEWMGAARIQIEGLERKASEQIPLDTRDWQWKLADASDRITPLSEYQGQVILINFWSVGCPPCVAELPSLEELYKEYGDRVVFLFVSYDSPQRALGFLENKHIDIPVVFPVSAVPPKMKTGVIPTTVIIDKSGKIRTRKTGAMNWTSGKVKRFLDKLLNE
ncbi:MAG: TlpA family protein disulfide reductase [Chlorobi bacterium]|nr:TlpA family protein disulfide reductase [Chlorobiota bacterium]